MPIKEAKEAWLQCEISKGMLPEECTVVCTNADDVKLSLFVSQSLINPENNSIKVSVMDCQDDICLVNLPIIPFENHSRTIKVNKSSISIIGL